MLPWRRRNRQQYRDEPAPGCEGAGRLWDVVMMIRTLRGLAWKHFAESNPVRETECPTLLFAVLAAKLEAAMAWSVSTKEFGQPQQCWKDCTQLEGERNWCSL